MRPFFFLSALVALVLADPSVATAQSGVEVESTSSVSLTARFTQPSASGSKIAQFRLGTKDLIEAEKDARGLTGTGGKLVVRRDIADIDFENSEQFLVFRGTYYPVEDGVGPLPVELPDTFYGSAKAVTLRRTDGEKIAFTEEMMDAIDFGDLATDGFEMVVAGLGRRSARMKTVRGIDIGFLFSRETISVMGGLRRIIDQPPFQVHAILTGTFTNGQERIVP